MTILLIVLLILLGIFAGIGALYLFNKKFKDYINRNYKKVFAIVASGGLVVIGGGIVFDETPTGTDYYVAKVANGGDDTNHNGLYPTDEGDANGPFSTIQHALSHATTAGDTINIREGSYNEYVHCTASGSAGNPITIRNYLNEVVYINGTGVSIPSGYALICLWKSTGSPSYSYITIKNLHLINSLQNGIRNLDSPTHAITGITIENCTFESMKYRAIYMSSNNIVSYPLKYVNVSNCTFDNICWQAYPADGMHEGITFYGCGYSTFRDNLILNCSEIIVDIIGNSHDFLFHNNTIYNQRIPTDPSPVYNSAIYLSPNNINEVKNLWNITISYNKIYTAGLGLKISGEYGGAYVRNVTVINNVFYPVATCINVHLNAVGHDFHLYNLSVMYNTFYSTLTTTSAIRLNIQDSYVHNFTFANNIFTTISRPLLYCHYYPSFSNSELHFINNIYYRTDGSAPKVLFSSTYYNPISLDSSAIIGNPKFVDLPGSDFHLNSSSPAIDAVDNIYTVDDDKDFNQRPQLTAYDIGAYEYMGGTPIVTLLSPQDGEEVAVIPTCSVYALDEQGDLLTIKWYENTTGVWKLQQTNASVINGTYRWVYDNASVPDTTYYWSINCTDADSNYRNITYHFFTGTMYYATIRNDGIDYFTWMGANVTASTVAGLIDDFDEVTEYIAIWNLTTWSTTDGLWDKFYYGDVTGIWTVHTFGVIQIYLTDSGEQEITMISNNDIDYSLPKTVTVTLTAQNKGSNYTGYSGTNVNTLSGVAGETNLATGEMIAWWDTENHVWRAWIIDFSTSEEDYYTTQNDVFWTRVGGTRTIDIGGQ